MAAATARITLDFDLRKEPIEGRLRGDSSRERKFIGYMQLVTVLEAALHEARRADRVARRADDLASKNTKKQGGSACASRAVS